LIRFTSQNGVNYAGNGVQRRAACSAAHVMPISSARPVPLTVEIEFVPQGGAKAP
jgi:hypothetical protein